nr:rhodanese-like domain-containing protein [Micrococcus sp. KRD026]
MLDVREDWERRLRRVEAPATVADRHVPLEAVLAEPAALAPGQDRVLVVYCAAGARSARARDAVVGADPSAGGRVLSLAGGLAAWPA